MALYVYMNFISSTPLLRIFYSWSKHKSIRTVRQYSGSLAHPRGMYFNGKEGRKEGDDQRKHGMTSINSQGAKGLHFQNTDRDTWSRLDASSSTMFGHATGGECVHACVHVCVLLINPTLNHTSISRVNISFEIPVFHFQTNSDRDTVTRARVFSSSCYI